jgi:hypothetical protein
MAPIDGPGQAGGAAYPGDETRERFAAGLRVLHMLDRQVSDLLAG